MSNVKQDFTADIIGINDIELQTANGFVIPTTEAVPMTINAYAATIDIQERLQKARLLSVLKTIGHGTALGFVIDNNNGGNNLYHSTSHCFGVAHYAMEIAAGEYLSNEEFAGLVLGAVFHDYNHTAANVADSVNIEFAILGLREYRATLKEPTGIAWANFDLVFQLAEDCIRVTEFPFVHEPRQLIEQIIRDADLLYASASPNSVLILDGLREELENKLDTRIPLNSFVEQQRRFMAQAKFFTPAGNEMFKAIKGPSLNLLAAYAETRDE